MIKATLFTALVLAASQASAGCMPCGWNLRIDGYAGGGPGKSSSSTDHEQFLTSIGAPAGQSATFDDRRGNGFTVFTGITDGDGAIEIGYSYLGNITTAAHLAAPQVTESQHELRTHALFAQLAASLHPIDNLSFRATIGPALTYSRVNASCTGALRQCNFSASHVEPNFKVGVGVSFGQLRSIVFRLEGERYFNVGQGQGNVDVDMVSAALQFPL